MPSLLARMQRNDGLRQSKQVKNLILSADKKLKKKNRVNIQKILTLVFYILQNLISYQFLYISYYL